jgi:hypothetical protein
VKETFVPAQREEDAANVGGIIYVKRCICRFFPDGHVKCIGILALGSGRKVDDRLRNKCG